jgi:hypothetical protein
MSRKIKKIVQSHCVELEEELNVSVLSAKLFSKCVIDHQFKVDIDECDKERHTAARMFMHHMHENFTDEKFYEFVRILRESVAKYPDHADLAEKLSRSVQLPSKEQGISEKQPESSETVSQLLQTTTNPIAAAREESYLSSNTGKVTSTLTDMEDVLGPNQGASLKQNYDPQACDFDIPQAAAAQVYYDEFDAVPESSREKSYPPEVIPDCALMFEKDTYRSPANAKEEAEYDTSDESGDEEDQENAITVHGSSTGLTSVRESSIHFDSTEQDVAQKPEKVRSQDVPIVSLAQHHQAQSTTVRGGKRANLDPSKFKEVCYECWKRLSIQRMNAKAGRCQHQKDHPLTGKQTPQKRDGCRPRTSASKLIFCKNEHPCPKGKHCIFAHGRKELEHWKASPVSAPATCKECLDENTKLNADLVVNKCLNKRHAHIPMVVVYEDDMEKVLQLIRCPTKTQIMKGKRSNHNFHNCGMEDPSACDYPHNKIEEMLWCKWKENNYASLDPIAVYDSPEKLIEFHGLLASLCGGCSPVKTRVSSAGAQVNQHAPTVLSFIHYMNRE